MALPSSSAPTSPLPRQLLRYVSSQLVAALNRPAPTISSLLPSAPLGAVDAAASQRLRATSRAAPSPKGRPGAPRPGGGGHVHAAPVMATTTSGVVMRGPATPPGGPPAQDSSGGKTHVAPATAKAKATAAAGVIMGGQARAPAPSSVLPAQGSASGEKVDAALVAASLLAVRRPKAPPTPREGSGGRGGIIHAAVAAADS